jgi:hypothetical protein
MPTPDAPTARFIAPNPNLVPTTKLTEFTTFVVGLKRAPHARGRVTG